MSQVGVVLDIDGVLWKEGKPIEGASEALRKLREAKIPVMFVTNGGGTPARIKAKKLGECLGVEINPEHVIAAHTPLVMVGPQYKDKLVVIAGLNQQYNQELAQECQFNKFIDLDEFIKHRPKTVPLADYGQPKTEYSNDRVHAVITVHEALEWRSALQVILDLLLSDGVVTKENFTQSQEQFVQLYVANPDFEYTGEFGAPRLTSGAFVLLLKTLYKEKTGRELKYQLFGKPYPEVYQYAIQCFNNQTHNNNSSNNNDNSVKTHYYAVGDNPLSDIKGANQAGWYSILVRTGVWQSEEANDKQNPANHVCNDVLQAVNHILQHQAQLKQ